MFKGHWGRIAAAMVAATLVAGACSSGSNSSSGNASASSTTVKVDTAVLGPVKTATGQPIRIGYMYQGATSPVDNTNDLKIAKATTKYINEHRGGLAGRPIELVTCDDKTTPAGATDCANELVGKKVVAVLSATPANAGNIMKVLDPAKVPFFVEAGADPSVLFTKYAFVLNNPLGFIAATSKLAQQEKLKKVAVIRVDVPAAAQVDTISKPLFRKAHLDDVVSPVPLGTPDVTPQVQAALSNGAQLFLIVGDIGLCSTTLKALKTLGYKGKVVANLNCLNDPSAKAIPGGFDGLEVAATYINDGTNADSKLLRAIGATYAPGTPTDDTGSAAHGFVMMMGLVRGLSTLTASQATPAGIQKAFSTMPAEPLPLLPSYTFQCNGKQSTLLPSVCSNAAALVPIAPSGEPKAGEAFDAAPYLSMK